MSAAHAALVHSIIVVRSTWCAPRVETASHAAAYRPGPCRRAPRAPAPGLAMASPNAQRAGARRDTCSRSCARRARCLSSPACVGADGAVRERNARRARARERRRSATRTTFIRRMCLRSRTRAHRRALHPASSWTHL
eukprot:7380415-Prymnesium_polylepis.2